MINIKLNNYIIAVVFLFAFISCKTSVEELKSPTLNDYFPLQTGKYITYQLDSLVYTNFGTRDTTISYQVKYVTDSMIFADANQKTYRILRYIRKSSNQSWSPDAAYLAMNTGSSIQFTENNLKFIKLQMPVSNDFSWKGNAYIETTSAESQVRYLDNWNYTYSNVGNATLLSNNENAETITVNQRDETVGYVDNPDSYSEINFAQEKYAKGIGMVYRKFFHKEYQPGSGSGGYVAEGSYGVTYTMIDHN